MGIRLGDHPNPKTVPDKDICPKCGGVLIMTSNKRTGIPFMGCSNYPRCTYTRNLGAPAPVPTATFKG